MRKGTGSMAQSHRAHERRVRFHIPKLLSPVGHDEEVLLLDKVYHHGAVSQGTGVPHLDEVVHYGAVSRVIESLVS